jgi:hypothetical protein
MGLTDSIDIQLDCVLHMDTAEDVSDVAIAQEVQEESEI